MRLSHASRQSSLHILVPCFSIDHDLLVSLIINCLFLSLVSQLLQFGTTYWFRTYAHINLPLQHDIEIVAGFSLIYYTLSWLGILILQIFAYFQEIVIFDVCGSLFEELKLRDYWLDFLVQFIFSTFFAWFLQNLYDLP